MRVDFVLGVTHGDTDGVVGVPAVVAGWEEQVEVAVVLVDEEGQDEVGFCVFLLLWLFLV